MCLSKVTKVNRKPVEKTFYKVFGVKKGQLFNLSWETGAVHFVGEKREEYVKFKIDVDNDGKIRKYTSGFHGFATKIGAEAWKNHPWIGPYGARKRIFKCRGLVRTEGYQHCNSKVRKYKSFVADTMEIIGEV
jgi:hypothetical protein